MKKCKIKFYMRDFNVYKNNFKWKMNNIYIVILYKWLYFDYLMHQRVALFAAIEICVKRRNILIKYKQIKVMLYITSFVT